MPKRHPIVVIGGGAAGILAAWKAASGGAEVVLLERNKKLGIKLLISGGGKCNITHAGTINELLSVFPAVEARFLKPAFHMCSNEVIVKMIEDSGVKTYSRPNGRVFPLSGDADDVVNALVSYLRSTGVGVRLNARAEEILVANAEVHGVKVDGTLVPSSHVILATGGVSYPKTGTTGDGFHWARNIGHTIAPLRPALAPIGIDPPLPREWQGVALRGGCLMVFSGGKKAAEWHDDILFSHEGVSGPAALELSLAAARAQERQNPDLRFDFFPAKDFNGLDQELNRVILHQRDKMIASILGGWLPDRIVAPILKSLDIDPAKRGHVLTREERRAITTMLKSWTIGKVARIDIQRGEVTAGGVSLDEVESRTMRSRKVKGLYVCGEVLDIAGPIGGYNLQAAFSTGFVAGKAAQQDWTSTPV